MSPVLTGGTVGSTRIVPVRTQLQASPQTLSYLWLISQTLTTIFFAGSHTSHAVTLAIFIWGVEVNFLHYWSWFCSCVYVTCCGWGVSKSVAGREGCSGGAGCWREADQPTQWATHTHGGELLSLNLATTTSQGWRWGQRCPQRWRRGEVLWPAISYSI